MRLIKARLSGNGNSANRSTTRSKARVVALIPTLLAGLLFAIAIVIFQYPRNRYYSGDTEPSGEIDAFPLTVVSLFNIKAGDAFVM